MPCPPFNHTSPACHTTTPQVKRSHRNFAETLDIAGRQYAADSMASSDSMVFDLNPGFTLPVKVAFDVPPGTAISALVVHDSMFSGGARISLP